MYKMTEWLNILSSSPRTIVSTFDRGILQQVSNTTEHAIIYFPKSDKSKYIHMTWGERIPHMMESVEFCTAFRIEVLIENDHVITYILSVNPTIFKSQIEKNYLLGEHHIISLIKNMWKNCTTHSMEITPPYFCDVDSEYNEIWNNNMILLEHQIHSFNYMKNTEDLIFTNRCIKYNNNVDIPDTEYCLDLMSELFVKTPDMKTLKIRGAFLCDEAGSGKTVVCLKLISDVSQKIKSCTIKHNYYSRATLVIVPLNLPNQWYSEIERFYELGTYHVVKLWKASDMKNLSMHDLINADIVITTISFIKSCKNYNDMLSSVINDNVKGNIRKSRALFNTISRNVNIDLPILQIIRWKRIIVDEIHEVKGRDLRILKCFNCEIMWGLTATPNLSVNDELNDINFMFEELSFNHPNVYKNYIEQFIKGYSDIKRSFPNNDLKLVELSEREKSKTSKLSPQDMILKCSTFDESVTFCQKTDLNDIIIKPEESLLNENSTSLKLKQKGIVATCLVLCALWCVETLRHNKVKKNQLIYKLVELLVNQRKSIDSITDMISLISTIKRRKHFMEENLKRLDMNHETCPICMQRECSVITRCGHLFCIDCISRHLSNCKTCPNCRHENSRFDTFKIASKDENSKFNAIQDMTNTMHDPVIIFAQWKKVLRDLKLILDKSQSNVFILEGNVAQRNSILNEFKEKGGILLLCATDSFAGIRLTNVKYIIFSHALFGDYNKVKSMELQAIGRAMKRDNANSLSVVSIVSKGEEESFWRTTHPNE